MKLTSLRWFQESKDITRVNFAQRKVESHLLGFQDATWMWCLAGKCGLLCTGWVKLNSFFFCGVCHKMVDTVVKLLISTWGVPSLDFLAKLFLFCIGIFWGVPSFHDISPSFGMPRNFHLGSPLDGKMQREVGPVGRPAGSPRFFSWSPLNSVANFKGWIPGNTLKHLETTSNWASCLTSSPLAEVRGHLDERLFRSLGLVAAVQHPVCLERITIWPMIRSSFFHGPLWMRDHWNMVRDSLWYSWLRLVFVFFGPYGKVSAFARKRF